VLLGLVFVVFGLNGFLHFLPMPPMSATAGTFFGGLAAAGYFLPLLFLTQVVGGLLLLSGTFVPLALALLAPVVLNIFLFHLFVEPSGLPLAIVVGLLELFLAWAYRDAFAPMLRPRIEG
jgi:hypothetical protein